MREVFKRFLRGFRFSNVVLLKRTTFENLWKTSKRFLKGSRSPEVFQRFFRGFSEVFGRHFSYIFDADTEIYKGGYYSNDLIQVP